MPSASPRANPDRPASTPPAGRQLGWRRLVLLVVLLNSPMFFQGCESQKFQFTLGAAVPFSQIEANDQQPLLPTTLVFWSWPKLLANVGILALALWLASRVAWLNRTFASNWFAAVLLLVALVFDLWLIWPPGWEQVVLNPQAQIYALILHIAGESNTPSPNLVWWAMLLSGRVYYVLLVVGLSLSFVLAGLFLRRYFFVRTGARWQVQLGGLVIVMLLLGSAVGVAIRLLMPQ